MVDPVYKTPACSQSGGSFIGPNNTKSVRQRIEQIVWNTIALNMSVDLRLVVAVITYRAIILTLHTGFVEPRTNLHQ